MSVKFYERLELNANTLTPVVLMMIYAKKTLIDYDV